MALSRSIVAGPRGSLKGVLAVTASAKRFFTSGRMFSKRAGSRNGKLRVAQQILPVMRGPRYSVAAIDQYGQVAGIGNMANGSRRSSEIHGSSAVSSRVSSVAGWWEGDGNASPKAAG